MSFPQERALTRTVTTLWTVLIAFALAVAGLWLASWDMSNPPLWWERILNTIGNTLFAIGIISLAYELGLRRHVHRELLALIGMQGSLLDSRIISAGKSTELNWGLILGDRSSYAFLLLRPLPWIRPIGIFWPMLFNQKSAVPPSFCRTLSRTTSRHWPHSSTSLKLTTNQN